MLSRTTPRYLSDWICSMAVKLVVGGSDVKIYVADVCMFVFLVVLACLCKIVGMTWCTGS